MAKIKAVLFDLGDTLMAHLGSKSELFRWFCEQASVPLPDNEEFVRAAAAAGWREGMKRINPMDWKDLKWREYVFRTGLAKAGIVDGREKFVEKMMKMNLPKPTNEVQPKVFSLLKDLRDQGYKLAIVSNYYGNLSEVLQQKKLAPLFHAAFDSDIVGMAKPEPRLFHMACEALGVTPEESLFVGDLPPYDVDGAIRAGIRPILFDPCGIWSEYGDYTQIHNIRLLEELRKVLKMI